MRFDWRIKTGLAVLVCGLCVVGCNKKAEEKPKLDPHSTEAVKLQVMALGAVLREGVNGKDFAYVADRAYYLQGVAKALHSKLDAGEQQRLGGVFNNLIRAAAELDHAAGRRHEGATVASMEKVEGLLKELEAQLGAGGKQ
jgi:hypothetical protein